MTMKHYLFSGHINAWTLNKALKKLGIKAECLIKGDAILPPTTSKKPSSKDVLFFTDEKSLLEYYNEDFHFYPKSVKKNILDDKLNFARLLLELGEPTVPFTGIETEPIDFPVYLKARHSWLGGKLMPRGFICRNKTEYTDQLSKITELGYKEEKFFHQKLLKSPSSNNYSVCGFYDYKAPSSNIICVTKRLISKANQMSTCAMVETVEDKFNLIERTLKILDKIEFSGPFEMEYLRDESDNKIYVLEFNPRFWMQHGIFVNSFDNLLVKRYIGYGDDKTKVSFKKILWIDGIYFIRELFNFRFKPLIIIIRKFFAGSSITFWPDLFTSFTYLTKLFFKYNFKKE